VFVTDSTTNATSDDITYYNSIVQNEADAILELASLNLTWTAIASTPTVDARDNTGTNPITSSGVPIYTLQGLIIADDNSDLWDHSIQNGINISPTGADLTGVRPWSGSARNGISIPTDSLGYPLNDDTVVGEAGQTNAGWIHRGLSNQTFLRPLFGISTPITVQAPTVPEPGAITLMTIGLVGLGGYSYRRKRKPSPSRVTTGLCTPRPPRSS
jgi:hypothetical protein